jgi:phage tail tape-measure protein
MDEKEILENIKAAAKSPAVMTIGGAAAAGAVLGSFVPVVGTAVGAAVGGLIGSAGIFIHELKKKNNK